MYLDSAAVRKKLVVFQLFAQMNTDILTAFSNEICKQNPLFG